MGGCDNHPNDRSSSVGVCASCLRHRLAVQERAGRLGLHDRRNSDTQLPPLFSFPRSVSPYIFRQKSDNRDTAEWKIHGGGRGFFSTPQVGITGLIEEEVEKNCKSKGGGISWMFSGIFRSKSGKLDSGSGQVTDSGDNCTGSGSWYSTILPGRRRAKIATAGQRRTHRNFGRGMSPARNSDGEVELCDDGSSGYSSESSRRWGKTPRRKKAVAGVMPTLHGKNLSGLRFCLSPLVRPSPNRRLNTKGISPEMVSAGESRVSAKTYFFTEASFSKNRSRKLADDGRVVKRTWNVPAMKRASLLTF